MSSPVATRPLPPYSCPVPGIGYSERRARDHDADAAAEDQGRQDDELGVQARRFTYCLILIQAYLILQLIQLILFFNTSCCL